jgi:uncharacterized protein YjdB
VITLAVGHTTRLTPKWSSANDSVATVNTDGTIKAVSPGTVEIYCAIGPESSAVRTIHVKEAPHK